ncbi:voltage-dependent calcium channel gamma-5 subunit-like [Babylonia areolata]|uniref:voltage-dependent calcium channel gamma-5 subunit-like n=1 Tax=Babylonia areolata TaxID=304850 RepID=UPI003FCEE901
MAAFTKRHAGYKIGLILFVCGMGAFCTGFGTPSWSSFRIRFSSSSAYLHGHSGLWRVCFKGIYDTSTCVTLQSTGWMDGVKGMQCTAVAVLCLAALYGIGVNFLTEKLCRYRVLEVALGLASGLGISSAVTYAVKSSRDEDFIDRQPGELDFDMSLDWSFGVGLAGSVLTMVAGILISCFNRPGVNEAQAGPAGGTVINPPHALPPPGTVYTVPGTSANNPQMAYYTAPPPTYPGYYGQGPVQGQGQVQGQGPMVFDTPPAAGYNKQ